MKHISIWPMDQQVHHPTLNNKYRPLGKADVTMRNESFEIISRILSTWEQHQ